MREPCFKKLWGLKDKRRMGEEVGNEIRKKEIKLLEKRSQGVNYREK